jgi:beta-galactosidase
MKWLILLTLVLTNLLVNPNSPLEAATSGRLRLLADYGWRFTLGDPKNAEDLSFDDTGWRHVDLPHDWSIEGPYSEDASTTGRGGYLPTGIGWYRRVFDVPHAWRGKRVHIEFDGVYMNSDVWINGALLGHRPYGYIPFEYDLTPYLRVDGRNVLSVRVDNSLQPDSRWYSGSGIDRHVWLTVSNPVHVAQWGTYITEPDVTSNSATVHITTSVTNDGAESAAASVVTSITLRGGESQNGSQTLLQTPAQTIDIQPGGQQVADQSVNVPSPQLWSIDTPTLYNAHTVVSVGGKIVDDFDTPFGIRTIAYDVDKGFLLNGHQVKMHGVCLHQDGGCVGSAVPIQVWERRLRLLKAMGCNAIRTSHNPPAPEFLDLCDRLGFVVMDEAFDEWTGAKVRYGYSNYFRQWGIRDLTDMIHRDRNHPSVVLWSVGNEIFEQTESNGADILRPLVETVHKEDPTRPLTAACDSVYTDHGGANLDFLNLLDIVGYNYVDRWGTRRETYYADDRRQFPDRKFIGTEDSNIGETRGSYSFGPTGSDGLDRWDYTSSMVDAEQLWKFVRTHDYVIGDFSWTGIDYLGEAEWPNKLNTSGSLDTCGFPKDTYYFWQSQWTNTPMVHLLPHWNWSGREGQVIPVLCYTNCSSVELFLNGKSFGAKSLEFPRPGTSGGWNSYSQPPVRPTTADLHLSWDVPYEPGTLKAVGYRNGEPICEDEITTAGPPASLVLEANSDSIAADPESVAQVTVKVVDSLGHTVPDASNLVSFVVGGPAHIIGIDNGDPANHDSYQASSRPTFNGLALAVVRLAGVTGTVSVTATSPGLASATITISVKPPVGITPILDVVH